MSVGVIPKREVKDKEFELVLFSISERTKYGSESIT